MESSFTEPETNIILYHTDQNREFSYGWVYETNECDEVIGLPGITAVKLWYLSVSVVDRGGATDIRLSGDRLITELNGVVKSS
jgi:hypothetical protein